jgi:hypothetical protein
MVHTYRYLFNGRHGSSKSTFRGSVCAHMKSNARIPIFQEVQNFAYGASPPHRHERTHMYDRR